MHFAEFGVVMMLFLIGLELEPSISGACARPLSAGLNAAGATTLTSAMLLMALGFSWQGAWPLVWPCHVFYGHCAAIAEGKRLAVVRRLGSFAVLLFRISPSSPFWPCSLFCHPVRNSV
jgi:hypothetical protein